jgi:hypothetical protein
MKVNRTIIRPPRKKRLNSVQELAAAVAEAKAGNGDRLDWLLRKTDREYARLARQWDQMEPPECDEEVLARVEESLGNIRKEYIAMHPHIEPRKPERKSS